MKITYQFITLVYHLKNIYDKRRLIIAIKLIRIKEINSIFYISQ